MLNTKNDEGGIKREEKEHCKRLIKWKNNWICRIRRIRYLYLINVLLKWGEVVGEVVQVRAGIIPVNRELKVCRVMQRNSKRLNTVNQEIVRRESSHKTAWETRMWPRSSAKPSTLNKIYSIILEKAMAYFMQAKDYNSKWNRSNLSMTTFKAPNHPNFKAPATYPT